ncbi:hypothetical protein DSO57_1028064 [Entomophthora muscae]|uniref:Uncharacterized protein n=1 Tax=Entomophthora muscae TaxID=34485 RepID=A0ACC2RGB8_9FUNG|nr:hypothetical protein DSO57_1028064 [Entomophthora muscae]
MQETRRVFTVRAQSALDSQLASLELAYPYPPSHTPVVLAKPPCAFDLEYFHPHHLDIPPVMKDIPTAPSLPDTPPTQDFSKLRFVYITVLKLADQVVPHTGSWHPLATALNYLVHIVSIVYMAFQAQPASPCGSPVWDVTFTHKASQREDAGSYIGKGSPKEQQKRGQGKQHKF